MKFNKDIALGMLIGWFAISFVLPFKNPFADIQNFFSILIYLDIGLFLSAFFGFLLGGDEIK